MQHRRGHRAGFAGWLPAVLLVGCALLLAIGPAFAAPAAGPSAAATMRVQAMATRAFTERRFQSPGSGSDCFSAPFVSYAHSDDYPQMADEWYNASQIWADLALAATDDPRSQCWAFRGPPFLDRLWDSSGPSGGFWPRSDLRGEQVVRVDKYADDNSLTGNVWVEAAARATSRQEREQMLGRARQTADFLIRGGLWDDAFGGGFWWNSRRGEMEEGKPAQTNALAAQFFLRLYKATGDPLYRDWALRTLDWLDQKLYNPSAELYRWTVLYEERSRAEGEVLSDRYFSYDQSILIEANLLAYRLFGGERRYLERAVTLGRKLDPLFWDNAHGGYNLELGVPQVYTVYSAWIVPGLLALYEEDGDPAWLARAVANVEALNATVWDRASGGYYQRHYTCGSRLATNCETGATWAVGPERSGVDQAWMQRAQALLASTLSR